MTTDEADAIIEFAARYWRNQWAPGETSQRSRDLILQAARVLLDAATDDICAKTNFIYSEVLQHIVDTDPAAADAKRLAAKALGDADEYRNTGKVVWESPLERVKRTEFNEDMKDFYRNRIWLLMKRTQRAETAARELANLLRNLAVRGEFRDDSGAIASVAKALTRHPEYAPDTSDRKEKETE